jgi:hypothetical protein
VPEPVLTFWGRDKSLDPTGTGSPNCQTFSLVTIPTTECICVAFFPVWLKVSISSRRWLCGCSVGCVDVLWVVRMFCELCGYSVPNFKIRGRFNK